MEAHFNFIYSPSPEYPAELAEIKAEVNAANPDLIGRSGKSFGGMKPLKNKIPHLKRSQVRLGEAEVERFHDLIS